MEISGTKKICVVTSSFPRYESVGAGNFPDNLIRALSKTYEINVIYPSNMKTPQVNSEPFFRHQISYPFQVYPMSQVHGVDNVNSIRLFLNMISETKKVVHKYDIDLIHAYWAIPSVFVASLCCGSKPVVITLPGSDIKIFGKKIYAICGGFHMKDHTQKDNLKIIAELQALGVQKVIPLHCTGRGAARLFHRTFSRDYSSLKEGENISL